MCNCAKLFQDFAEQYKEMIAGCQTEKDRDMVVDIYVTLFEKLFASHAMHLHEISESFNGGK